MNLIHLRSLNLIPLTLLTFALTISQRALGTEPAQASQPTSVQPRTSVKPKPVVVINRKTAKQTTLLDKDEVEKIKTLQKTIMPAVVSQISSDGTTIVVRLYDPTAKDPSFSLLNIQTGSQIAIASEQFQGFKPYPAWSWRDTKTVVAIAEKQAGEDSQYALVTVNRITKKVSVKPLSFLESLGLPISLAPNASRMLVEIKPPEPKDGEDEDDSGEDKPTEFRVVNLSGQQLYRFVLPAGIELSQVDWTPDGSRLAIIRDWTTNDLSPSGGESYLSPITQDAMGLLQPNDNPFLQKNALQTFNLKTGEQHLLSANHGDKAVFANLDWSPDGKTLLVKAIYPLQIAGRPHPTYGESEHGAFRFYDSRLQEVSRLDVPELANVENEGLSGSQFVSTDEVVFTALNGMNVQLYVYNHRSGKLKNLSTQPGSYGTYGFATFLNSRQVVYSYTSYTAPPELYRLSLTSGKSVPLTTFNEKVAKLSQTRTDALSFTLANGETLDGILIQPAGASFPARNVPLVVWQEGGPMASVLNEWFANVERPYALLPNFGISVLIVPLYGRYGFGTQRFNALYQNGGFGQLDIDAMAEIVKLAIAQGYTSPGNIGITGCSYGGYFATQSITRHPQMYAAANAQCTLIDSSADWKTRGRGAASLDYGGLTPYTNSPKFQQDSPIYNAARVQTPLLIFHGSQDFLPVTLMENFYWMVASQGTPTRMVKFMGEGHGLQRSEHQLYAAQEMIQWFRTYLKPDLSTTSRGK